MKTLSALLTYIYIYTGDTYYCFALMCSWYNFKTFLDAIVPGAQEFIIGLPGRLIFLYKTLFINFANFLSILFGKNKSRLFYEIL